MSGGYDSEAPDAGAAAAQAADRVGAALEKAAHLSEIGRHDLAERELRAVLPLAPESPDVHLALGHALRGQQRLDEAVAAAHEALRLEPDWGIGARMLLVAVDFERGQHCHAERLLLEVLHLHPTLAEGWAAYGALMQRTGHLQKAQRLLEHALRLDPELATAHNLMGVVLAERRRARQAATHARRGLALAPDDMAHSAIGVTYLATGRPFLARSHLREALRQDPSDGDTEQAFLQADRATRWTYLPMYWSSLLLDRLPGRQFTLWAVAIGATLALRAAGQELAAGILIFTYLGWVLYTWIAEPLTSAWIKLRPPR